MIQETSRQPRISPLAGTAGSEGDADRHPPGCMSNYRETKAPAITRPSLSETEDTPGCNRERGARDPKQRPAVRTVILTRIAGTRHDHRTC